ncbi:hypothetical protein VTI74DRAFT_4778 [Chaetomium olivicolor]
MQRFCSRITALKLAPTFYPLIYYAHTQQTYTQQTFTQLLSSGASPIHAPDPTLSVSKLHPIQQSIASASSSRRHDDGLTRLNLRFNPRSDDRDSSFNCELRFDLLHR